MRGITNNSEFNKLMEKVDESMRSNGVPIAGRELGALSEVARRLKVSIPLPQADLVPRPNDFSPNNLALLICLWIRERYGNRLTIDFSNGYSVFLLTGEPWLIQFPYVLGRVRLVCERDLSIDKTTIAYRDGNVYKPHRYINVLQCIKDLTQRIASEIPDREMKAFFDFFIFGHYFFKDSHMCWHTNRLGRDAISEICEASKLCISEPDRYGMARWTALSAAEKFFKAFIELQRGEYSFTHELSTLSGQAQSLGAPGFTKEILDSIQCKASVRYDPSGETSDSVMKAIHGAMRIGASLSKALSEKKRA